MPQLDTATLMAHWPISWIIVVAIFAFFAFDSYRAGISRTTAVALALPLSLICAQLFPQTYFLGAFATPLNTPTLHAAIIGVFFVLLYLLIIRMVDSFGGGGGGVLSALLAGAGTTVILIAVWTQSPVLSSLWQLAPLPAFFAESYRLFWLMGGYTAIAFARG